MGGLDFLLRIWQDAFMLDLEVMYPKGSANRKKNIMKMRMRLSYKKCHYCGCDVDLGTSTLDHIIPKSKGGRTKGNNLVISCAPCNLAKGSKDYKEFIEEINPRLLCQRN